MNLEIRFERRNRGGLNQPVHTESGIEADVVGDEDMIKAALARTVKKLSTPFEGTRQHELIGHRADAKWGRRAGGSVHDIFFCLDACAHSLEQRRVGFEAKENATC